MGYDTTLYVVDHYSHTGDKVHYDIYEHDGKTVKYLARPSGSVIATIDLSKAGYQTNTGRALSTARGAKENTGWELYLSGSKDGRAPFKDLYGEKVSSVPVSDLLDALKADNAVEYYRRFGIAIAVIEAVLKDFDPASIMIFQYGH